MTPPPPDRSVKNVVVLASGSGTLLQALLDAPEPKPYRIAAVGSDRTAASPWTGRTRPVCRPSPAGSPTIPIAHPGTERLPSLMASFNADLVVLAGFMKLVGPGFLAAFPDRVINAHPVAVAGLSRYARSRRRARPWGQTHRLHGVPGRRRHRCRADRGAARGAGARRRRCRIAARADQGDRAGAAGRGRRRADRISLHGDRTKGEIWDDDAESTAGAGSAEVPDGRRPIRRALLSVSDKTGLIELATALDAAGVALVSTGGSARAIADAGLPVTPVEQVTGFPECLDGRVKTLHPSIHGGLLADTRLPSHVQQIADLGIEPFDLVVVNLYPFRQTVAAGASFDDCVEQIDIGGPAMIRASAKNHPSVAVVVDPDRYPEIETAIAAGGFTLRRTDGTGRGGVRAHRCLRRRGRVLPQRRGQPGRRLAGLDRRHLGEGVLAAVRREPAPAGSALPALAARPGIGEAVARQGDELQQLRRRRRGVARGQPTSPTPRSRSSSTPTRVASRPSPVAATTTSRSPTIGRTPAIRCPRSAASSRSTGR